VTGLLQRRRPNQLGERGAHRFVIGVPLSGSVASIWRAGADARRSPFCNTLAMAPEVSYSTHL
jgi:hypothetical protein